MADQTSSDYIDSIGVWVGTADFTIWGVILMLRTSWGDEVDLAHYLINFSFKHFYALVALIELVDLFATYCF